MTDSPECNSFGYCPDRMARLAIRSAISLSRKVDFLCKTIVIWVLSNDQPISSLPEVLWNLNQSLSAKWTLCTQSTGNCTHSRMIALKIRKWTALILRADRQWYDTLPFPKSKNINTGVGSLKLLVKNLKEKIHRRRMRIRRLGSHHRICRVTFHDRAVTSLPEGLIV